MGQHHEGKAIRLDKGHKALGTRAMSQNRVRGHKGKAMKAIPKVQGLGSKGRWGLEKAMKARQVGQHQAAVSGVKKQAAIPKRVKSVHHRCEVLKTSEARTGRGKTGELDIGFGRG